MTNQHNWHQAQAELDRLYHQVSRTPAWKAAAQGKRNVDDAMEWIGQNPLVNGTMATLGTSERAGMGAADALTAGNFKGLPARVGRSVTDPEGDIEQTHRVENRVGTALFGDDWNKDTLNGPEQAVFDYAVQSLLDPATYVPGLDVISLLKRVGKFSKAGKTIEKLAKALPAPVREKAASTAQSAKNYFTASGRPLQGMQQSGLNVVRSHEAGQRVLSKAREAEYSHIIEGMRPELEHLHNTLTQMKLTGRDIRNHHVAMQLPMQDRLTLHKLNKHLTDPMLWREGDANVRKSLLSRGFKPSAEDAKLPTANLVKDDWGRRYLPEQNLASKEERKAQAEARGFRYKPAGGAMLGAALEKKAPSPTSPLIERVQDRALSSSFSEPKRRMEQHVLTDLGLDDKAVEGVRGLEGKWAAADRIGAELAKKHGHDAIIQHSMAEDEPDEFFALHPNATRNPKTNNPAPALKRKAKYEQTLAQQQQEMVQTAAKRAKFLKPGAPVTDEAIPEGIFPGHSGAIPEMPEALHDRMFGEKVIQEPSWLQQNVAKPFRTSLFANIVPHVSNLNQQMGVGGKFGGWSASAEGAAHAARQIAGDPQALKEAEEARLHGAMPVHGYGSHEVQKNPVARAYNAQQNVLTKIHEGQATVMFHKARKAGLSGPDAAHEVRKAFGNPDEQSQFTKDVSRTGAPFASWVTSTVPRGAVNSISSQKGRASLKNYARATSDINQDYFEPEYGVDLDPGGFSSRVANFAFEPGRYWSSPSVKGTYTAMGEDSKQRGTGDIIKSYVPGGGLLDIVKQPLKPKEQAQRSAKPMPLWLRAPAVIGGGHFSKSETPRHKAVRELIRQGLVVTPPQQ